MKTTKKLLSMFMAVLMLTSIFAVSASAAATKLNGSNSMSTATNIPSYNIDYAGSIDEAGQSKWYKLRTVSSRAYYKITATNNTIDGYTSYGTNVGTNLYIYDENQKFICGFGWGYDNYYLSKGNTVSKIIYLEPNETYYFKFGNENTKTGIFEIKVNYEIDNIGDTFETASPYKLGETKLEKLVGENDIDFYKFTTGSKKDKYTFTLNDISIPGKYDKYLHMEVYDSYKNIVVGLGWKYDSGFYLTPGNKSVHKAELDPNKTYYVKVYTNGAIGEYSFSIVSENSSTSYTATFKDNNGTKTVTGQNITAPSISSKSGWVSVGWTTTSGVPASVTVSAGNAYVLTSNKTFYALYKKDVTLSYNANGGINAPSSQTLTVQHNSCGLTQTAIFNVPSSKPTRDGYTFLGWSSNRNSNTADIKAGQRVELSDNNSTTLYAVWELNTNPDPTPSFWDSFVAFFRNIWNWFISLFA